MYFRNYHAFGIPDSDSAFENAPAELMPEGESRVWNNAIMELGGVACEKTPKCDEAGCPWREWCHAYETGDFTAPDGEYGREWLEGLLADLADDGLVEVEAHDSDTVARLRR